MLEKYSTVLALEELTTVHKKVYKRLSDNNDLFVKDSLEGQQSSDNKAKWNSIFEEWQDKIGKINRVQPNYEDKKIRNIFFVFLESIEFS